MITRGNARGLYWTFPQQLAHATVNGAAVRPGDLFASGHDLRLRARAPRARCSSRAPASWPTATPSSLRGRAGTIELGEVRGTIVSAP